MSGAYERELAKPGHVPGEYVPEPIEVASYQRGLFERFQWCKCGDGLQSLHDRLTGRCWICRSVR